jgi:hypothetical protein
VIGGIASGAYELVMGYQGSDAEGAVAIANIAFFMLDTSRCWNNSW